MVPVVAVVGYSNSGKTRVASFLVQSLSAQGYRVAAVKHCHDGHEIDRPGSDTSVLFNAGAAVVVASSPGQQTRIDRTSADASLEGIASAFGEAVDLIIAEGFKSSRAPKVLVAGNNGPPPEVDQVIAVVGDAQPPLAVPQFAFDDLPSLALLVRERLLPIKGDGSSVTLVVDGVAIPLRRYPSSVLMNLLEGFLASLDGVPSGPREIQVRLSKPS